jgi:hypothetical protein
MEGNVVFFSLFTLVKLIAENRNCFQIGIVTTLLGLSRPEFGVVSAIAISIIYLNKRDLIKFFAGIILSFILYWLFMSMLNVYPLPSTIWSKQLTGSLRLFSNKNLIEILPSSFANLMGFQHLPLVGYIFFIIPLLFSFLLKKRAIAIAIIFILLLIIAMFMPGNFAWYSENFMIFILAISVGIAIELYKSMRIRYSFVLSVLICAIIVLIIVTNFWENRSYPWNEGTAGFSAYQEVGKSSIGSGKYLLTRYSSNPVRIRMCEIGIASYFSGHDSWIYDMCGLAQIGNLKGAQTSWLRHLYPSSFLATGDDQLEQFKHDNRTNVIDIWALFTKEEAANAVGKCQYVDELFCINRYK